MNSLKVKVSKHRFAVRSIAILFISLFALAIPASAYPKSKISHQNTENQMTYFRKFARGLKQVNFQAAYHQLKAILIAKRGKLLVGKKTVVRVVPNKRHPRQITHKFFQL